jgi:hypothetical protein
MFSAFFQSSKKSVLLGAARLIVAIALIDWRH